MSNTTTQRGVASLPAIMAIIIFIVVISLGMTALSLTEIFISAGQNQSSQALFYAEAGAQDGLIRVARNKNYTCAITDCYSIDFITNGCLTNEGCARVTVSSGVGSGLDPKIITSKGQVKNKTRTIAVRVTFDASLHGEISQVTWTELVN